MAGLFKAKKPEVKPVAPMPDENDPAIRAAKRKQVSQMMGMGGRRSTILSEGFGGMEDWSKRVMG